MQPLADNGIQKTRSVCGYCGVGCSVDIMTKNDRIIGIQPAMDGPANEGALCVKGQFAYDYVHLQSGCTIFALAYDCEFFFRLQDQIIPVTSPKFS